METAKAIVGAIGLVVTALTAILADNVFDTSEAGIIVTVVIEAAMTTYAIWRIPNTNYVYRPGASPDRPRH